MKNVNNCYSSPSPCLDINNNECTKASEVNEGHVKDEDNKVDETVVEKKGLLNHYKILPDISNIQDTQNDAYQSNIADDGNKERQKLTVDKANCVVDEAEYKNKDTEDGKYRIF